MPRVVDVEHGQITEVVLGEELCWRRDNFAASANDGVRDEVLPAGREEFEAGRRVIEYFVLERVPSSNCPRLTAGEEDRFERLAEYNLHTVMTMLSKLNEQYECETPGKSSS